MSHPRAETRGGTGRQGAAAGLGRRRMLAHGAAVLAAAGPLAVACAGPGSQSAPEAASTSPGPVKITFGTKFGAGERADWAKQTVDRFNEQNAPRITVEHLVLGSSVQAPELLVMISSGTGPDVTQTSGAWFSDFAEKGALGDVTAYAKRDKVDLSRWYAQEEVFLYKGKYFGMPFWQSPGVYFYNASLFKRYNVALPNDNWTWDNMLEAARKLTLPGETWGLQTAYGWEKSWLHFIRANGANYINKEATKTTCNTPQAVEAMQWVVDLVQRHRVMAPAGDTSLGSGNLWNLGKVAIMIGGAGAIGGTLTARPDFEWDLFQTPRHPRTGRRDVTTTDNPMVVLASSKARDAAWKFNLFTAEKFAQDLLGKLRINMPVLKTSAADPQSWLGTPPAAMRMTLEYMKQSASLNFHKNWQQWNAETQNAVLPAFKGEIGIKDALDKAAQIGDTLLRGL